MKTIQAMYEHLDWANGRILESIQHVKQDHEQVTRLFAHILHAEQVWFTRLQGSDSSHLPIWSNANIVVCAKLVKENEECIGTYFSCLAPTELERVIAYQNSNGTEFQSTIRDILTHVALHGQYHRGQINLQLRTIGIEPMNVDFITFVR